MSIQISKIKNWNPEIEKEITSEWRKKGNPFNEKSKKIYSIDTPPPYVNSPIHIGHAVTYSYMDFFARYKRMKGFEVLFPIGLDRNGLPIEMAAEKKFNVSPFKISRDEFIRYCEKILEESSEESLDSFARLGISFNSYKRNKEIGSIYFTDSKEYRTLTQSTFIDLFEKGLIYEDTRINNWDPKLQTTISDSEIDYKETESKFNYIKWKIKETDRTIVIATTRPELICTCGMIIFNPEDKKYKNLEGKTAISPIYEKEIPIKAHPFANPDMASGLVMMCSAGDLTDIQFFREMNLTPVISINKNGTMNENSGFLKGLKVREAREKILEELQKLNLIEKQEKIIHKTPISERSKAEIEFIEMQEYYLKQLENLEKLKEEIKKIKFFPTASKKILDSWIDSLSIDWPISRRRFYATPIPLWHSGDLTALPPKGEYYQPWKENPPKKSKVYRKGKYIGEINKFKENWKGETRVFDTWFDSSISELFIINYPSEFSKKAYPITLRAQGKEIVRTWLYYSLLRGYYATGKPPFKEAWIHQHILDSRGKKMSKSVGNIINPHDIINNEGAEALRLWSAIEGNLAEQDLSCSRERVKAEQKTLNKLLNISKFISQFKRPKKAKLTSTDSLFIDYIEDLTYFTEENYDSYDFYKPSLKLRKFLWDVFASNYIELVKARVYNSEKKFSESESESAKYTLHYLLERLTLLLNPIIPQITQVISDSLEYKISEFPKSKKIKKDLEDVDKTIEFNSNIWKTKKERGISLRETIKSITIPIDLEKYKKDLISCHNIIT